jgi:hypothetical protein
MSIFFDPTYYLQNNPDVLAAVARGETTAEQHFNTFGWQEGRNPNAFFDVNFYLISNPDVLAAGVNPLTHFIQFGAAEGRSPSEGFVAFADFDTKTYAASNPDLAAAGLVTPSQLYAHFATFGFAENRPGVQTKDGMPIAGDAAGGTTFTLTWDLDQFTGTNANDLFQSASWNINPFDSINGGGGTDTMNIVGNMYEGYISAATITNVEIVNITDNGDYVDAADFGASLQQIWQINSVGYLDNVGETTTAGFRNVDDGNVNFTGTVGNVALDNVSNFFTLYSDGEITTLNISGSLEQNSDPDVVEVLELHDHTNDNSIETVNLSLSTGTEIVLVGGEWESLTTFDASDSTGNIYGFFDIDGGSLESLETIVLGSGSDNVEVDFWVDGTSSLATIDLGAGGDTVRFGDAGTGAFSGVTVTLGGGKDRVILEELVNIQDADEADFEADVISITDFKAADDVLDISMATGARVTLTDLQNAAVGLADSLFDAVAVVAGVVGVGSFATFQFSDSTYVLAENGAEGFNIGDGLVELTGFTGALTGDNFVF